jgi:hypothetical protein
MLNFKVNGFSFIEYITNKFIVYGTYVIIGNGIVELRLHVIFEKIRFKITIVSSETEFFFSRTALMYVFIT